MNHQKAKESAEECTVIIPVFDFSDGLRFSRRDI
jgi:hypothetical protein